MRRRSSARASVTGQRKCTNRVKARAYEISGSVLADTPRIKSRPRTYPQILQIVPAFICLTA